MTAKVVAGQPGHPDARFSSPAIFPDPTIDVFRDTMWLDQTKGQAPNRGLTDPVVTEAQDDPTDLLPEIVLPLGQRLGKADQWKLRARRPGPNPPAGGTHG